ncbi:hypothetical protein J3P91_10860 [Pseudomonas sp. Z4-7]|uniref:hypothetical protein n=1 Tax=Pseudomonas sp. Z4-7 TaxID=2817413 RepID=UPI003DA89E38
MDRLSKHEIEAALRDLLPGCSVECTLGFNGTASLLVEGHDEESFAVVGLTRHQFRGDAGLKKLARFIFEDIELARQGLKTQKMQMVSPSSFRTKAAPTLNEAFR